MKFLSLLRRLRPDHTCRAPFCPGFGDTEHLMCPDHRPSTVPHSGVRRWLTNPHPDTGTADHRPRRGWADNWQGRRP